MANRKQAALFDKLLQEDRRKANLEKLAQEMLGKKGRASAPPSGPKGGLGASLASRIGVTKRAPSIPRSTTPRQNARSSAQARPAPNDKSRPRLAHTQSASETVREKRSNGYEQDIDGAVELNIKGAASGPFLVMAQNFAPGTTADDIESVMLSVGGAMTGCRLVASNPTVIAEMSFVEKSGAEKVIDTFNGKKADGRPLYVYWKGNSGVSNAPRDEPRPVEPEVPAVEAEGEFEDVVMQVDSNVQSREAENRAREERRAPQDDRAPRANFPTGPRGYQGGGERYEDRRPRHPDSGYQDSRYAYGGGGGWHGGPPQGRYDDRRYRGGQNWRR